MACTCDQLTSVSRSSGITPPVPETETAALPAAASVVPEPSPEVADFRFDAGLRARLEANLARLERVSYALDGRRHAAVAVVVVDSDADAHGADLHPASAEALKVIP